MWSQLVVSSMQAAMQKMWKLVTGVHYCGSGLLPHPLNQTSLVLFTTILQNENEQNGLFQMYYREGH